MAKYIVDGDSLEGIADVIRYQAGTDDPLEFPEEFMDKIGSLAGYNFLPNVKNLKANVGNGLIKLRWNDPELDPTGWIDDPTSIPEWVLEDISIYGWAGTQIRMKIGSYPAHELDGTLVVDNKIHDAYADNDLIIENLTNGTEYYIMAFPYTERRKFRVDAANRVKATPIEFDDVWGTPGAEYLLSGNMDEGFFGEVSQGDFITFAALTTACGITAGTAYNSTEPWLKHASGNTILFSPRKPIRYGISWYSLNSKKCVYGDPGDTVVKIGDHYFKVRLFRGLKLSNDPKVLSSAYNGAACHGSEWNRLICSIHERAYDESWGYPNNVESPIAPLMHNLGSGNNGLYTDADLLTHRNHGNGYLSWCQENVYSTKDRLIRGSNGVSSSTFASSSSANTDEALGWRPVLELVQGP